MWNHARSSRDARLMHLRALYGSVCTAFTPPLPGRLVRLLEEEKGMPLTTNELDVCSWFIHYGRFWTNVRCIACSCSRPRHFDIYQPTYNPAPNPFRLHSSCVPSIILRSLDLSTARHQENITPDHRKPCYHNTSNTHTHSQHRRHEHFKFLRTDVQQSD